MLKLLQICMWLTRSFCDIANERVAVGFQACPRTPLGLNDFQYFQFFLACRNKVWNLYSRVAKAFLEVPHELVPTLLSGEGGWKVRRQCGGCPSQNQSNYGGGAFTSAGGRVKK